MEAQPNLSIVHPAARHHLCRLLRDAVRESYRLKLIAKLDQGKVFKVTSRWSDSNHFIRTGVCTRFADWRFIHRARLDCVPLNATRRFGDGPTGCRRCANPLETLPHVLSCCLKHSHARQLRHNNIVHRVANAVPRIAGVVSTDRRIVGSDSPLRPDIVVTDQQSRTMTIVDVAVVFENGTEPFDGARQQKIHKYSALADYFRTRGWTVHLDAIIVGALGGWDPNNEATLRTLRISKRYCKMMRRYIVSDTIRWSRDIYIEHLSGQRQYDPIAPPIVAARSAATLPVPPVADEPDATAPIPALIPAAVVPSDSATELNNSTDSTDGEPEPANVLVHSTAEENEPVVSHEPANVPENFTLNDLFNALDAAPVTEIDNSFGVLDELMAATLDTPLYQTIVQANTLPAAIQESSNPVAEQQMIANLQRIHEEMDATDATATHVRRRPVVPPPIAPLERVNYDMPNFWEIDDNG